MKKDTVMKYINLFGIPVLTAVIGLILLVSPDSATTLISRIIGWALIFGGAALAISIANTRPAPVGRWILAALGVAAGVAILKNPLWLAESIGRVVGLILVINGSQDLKYSVHRKTKILALVTLAAGVLLFLTPMSLFRALLRLVGMVVAIVGAVNIVEKLQEVRLLESGSRPSIVDADE